VNRRNITIAHLRIVASDHQASIESRLAALHKLTRLRPGKPLAHCIRATLKEILRDHPDDKGLFVDVRQVLDDLNEARRQKIRFLELRKSKPVPPFSVPAEFKMKFAWSYKIHKQGRLEWALHER
jgi:hypothetical protein